MIRLAGGLEIISKLGFERVFRVCRLALISVFCVIINAMFVDANLSLVKP